MRAEQVPGIPFAHPRRLLLGSAAAIAALGLAAELLHYLGGVESSLVSLLSLSYEGNVPTWYASMLLFACALALAANAAAARQPARPARPDDEPETPGEPGRAPAHPAAGPRPWAALAAIFLYMSLDESVGFHEDLGSLAGGMIDLSGVLYFGWVVPATAILALVGLAFLPFVLRLPASTRQRFVVAGLLYVGGALVLELPLGWWTERAGNDNLVYALIDFVEESLELLGASLFLLAVLDHLGRGHLGRGQAVRQHGPDLSS